MMECRQNANNIISIINNTSSNNNTSSIKNSTLLSSLLNSLIQRPARSRVAPMQQYHQMHKENASLPKFMIQKWKSMIVRSLLRRFVVVVVIVIVALQQQQQINSKNSDALLITFERIITINHHLLLEWPVIVFPVTTAVWVHQFYSFEQQRHQVAAAAAAAVVVIILKQQLQLPKQSQ